MATPSPMMRTRPRRLLLNLMRRRPAFMVLPRTSHNLNSLSTRSCHDFSVLYHQGLNNMRATVFRALPPNFTILVLAIVEATSQLRCLSRLRAGIGDLPLYF